MMVYFPEITGYLTSTVSSPEFTQRETKVAPICVESIRTVGSCLKSCDQSKFREWSSKFKFRNGGNRLQLLNRQCVPR